MLRRQFQQIHISGRNFIGQVKRTQTSIKLDLTQYKKGQFHTSQITNADLKMQSKRYLIFDKIEDLYDQMQNNKNMIITDQHHLLLPVEITYKNKKFVLNVEILLNRKSFRNQDQKIQSLFSQIEKLNTEKNQIEKENISIIQFRADQKNANYTTSFQLSQDQSRVRKVGQNRNTTLNHFQTLPNKGVFSFKVKVVRTTNKVIFLGICGQNIKSAIDDSAYFSQQFMGLYLYNGCLYGNNKHPTVTRQFQIIEGQSIFTVQINMDRMRIKWYLDDELLYSTQIAKEMHNLKIYPMINLYHYGDMLQFINK